MLQMANVKKRRGRRKVAEERVEATPETLAKLEADQLLALLQTHAGGDMAIERAAEEIRAVYFAVCRSLMPKASSYGDRTPRGLRDMPEALAWAHSQTYLPWAQAQLPRVMEAVIDITVYRRPIYPAFNLEVIASLRDYAKRMVTRNRH